LPPIGFVASLAKLMPSGFATTCAQESKSKVTGHTLRTKLRTDLVGQDHRQAKFGGHARQLPQKLREVLLPLGKLSAPNEICAEVRCGWVYDEKNEAVLGHERGGLLQEFHLLLGVVCARVDHVFKDLLGAHAVALSNGHEAVGAKTTFRVYVHGLAFSATLRQRQLARNAQRVAQLRFSGPEFAEDLRAAVQSDDAGTKDVKTREGIQSTVPQWEIPSRRRLGEVRPVRMSRSIKWLYPAAVEAPGVGAPRKHG
jgi:hypothetical protein